MQAPSLKPRLGRQAASWVLRLFVAVGFLLVGPAQLVHLSHEHACEPDDGAKPCIPCFHFQAFVAVADTPPSLPPAETAPGGVEPSAIETPHSEPSAARLPRAPPPASIEIREL